MHALTWRSVLLTSACSLILTGLSGCNPIPLVVRHGDPRPNIALTRQTRTLKLMLGKSVADNFTVQVSTGTDNWHRYIDVTKWHGTLRNGFKNGFGEAYTLIWGDEAADSVLTTDETDLAFLERCSENASTSCTQVRYKVTLSDAKGTAQRAAGTGTSKREGISRADGQIYDLTPNVESAVESMYEKIAKDLFNDLTSNSAK